MKTSTALIVVVILVALVGAGWWYYGGRMPTGPAQTNEQPIAKVAFACDAGKSIGAAFYDKRVALDLSDGRTMELPQTISGSGIRYANSDESFVFWSKGNTAFVEEGSAQQETYQGCIIVAPDTSNTLTQVYATSTAGFTLRFPQGYTVKSSYVYQALGPGKDIHGVSFTIPERMSTGTNLAHDSYVSVEWLPSATSCTADKFVSSTKTSAFSDAGTDYSVATSSDAGAGNLYEEMVFAIPGTSPCTAVRYFIHSTQIANYPAGTVTAFDKAALIDQFDAIRRTLVLGR